ncbi:unnamed protein product [Meloidogyne enterolobii]|uniref:Uncharacterized protein n=1 Tax=Meloidogyne enterolobii TaxID=390850 RepID=A0ACB0ZEX6_MELEN
MSIEKPKLLERDESKCLNIFISKPIEGKKQKLENIKFKIIIFSSIFNYS